MSESKDVVSYPSIQTSDPLAPQEVASASSERVPGYQVPRGEVRGSVLSQFLGAGATFTDKVSIATGGVDVTHYFTHNLNKPVIIMVTGTRSSTGLVTGVTQIGEVGTGGAAVFAQLVDANTISTTYVADVSGNYNYEWDITIYCLVLE